MKAAIDQGLIDKVKWGSTTPIANTFMAAQFPQFDGKMFIDQEFGLLDASQGPDTRLMLAVLKKYTKIDPQAFAQMGFMAGKFATIALLNVKGAVTAKSYNKAVRALKNVKTDMLCKPWYVGNLPYHIPNNANIGVDLQGRQGRPQRQVLQHRACRQGDRPDARLGEEVQAQHRLEP